MSELGQAGAQDKFMPFVLVHSPAGGVMYEKSLWENHKLISI